MKSFIFGLVLFSAACGSNNQKDSVHVDALTSCDWIEFDPNHKPPPYYREYPASEAETLSTDPNDTTNLLHRVASWELLPPNLDNNNDDPNGTFFWFDLFITQDGVPWVNMKVWMMPNGSPDGAYIVFDKTVSCPDEMTFNDMWSTQFYILPNGDFHANIWHQLKDGTWVMTGAASSWSEDMDGNRVQ